CQACQPDTSSGWQAWVSSAVSVQGATSGGFSKKLQTKRARVSSPIWAFTLNPLGEFTMRRTIAFVSAVAFCAVSSVHADYAVTGNGTWPKNWPKELEPLRKQASTFEGPLAAHQHYAIPFTKREQFESAWPHILKLKSKGAPVRLVRGPNFFLAKDIKAGVIVHCPPPGQSDNPADTTY